MEEFHRNPSSKRHADVAQGGPIVFTNQQINRPPSRRYDFGVFSVNQKLVYKQSSPQRLLVTSFTESINLMHGAQMRRCKGL